MKISSLAGKPAPAGILVDVPRLITAYFTGVPDPSVPAQRVAFGTSGHRGSSFDRAFNEWHVLAITQAICLYRAQQAISGPLYLGIDTHALSAPACATALEVLAANGVEVMIAAGDDARASACRRRAWIRLFRHGCLFASGNRLHRANHDEVRRSFRSPGGRLDPLAEMTRARLPKGKPARA